jgi:hypothetical protein
VDTSQVLRSEDDRRAMTSGCEEQPVLLRPIDPGKPSKTRYRELQRSIAGRVLKRPLVRNLMDARAKIAVSWDEFNRERPTSYVLPGRPCARAEESPALCYQAVALRSRVGIRAPWSPPNLLKITTCR